MHRGALALGICFCLQAAAPGAQTQSSYDDLVAIYRGGAFEVAIDRLKTWGMSADHQREMRRWVHAAAKAKRTDDLAAALLLHSEIVFIEFGQEPHLARSLTRTGLHLSAVTVVHGSLKSLAPHAPVLRCWYLLWESFRQGFLLPELDRATNYLPDALNAFPNDAELLLAAGTRHELYWWSAPDNSQRTLSSGGGATNHLRTAERWFRKSLESNPSGHEARLRLGRVMSALGSFDGAKKELAQMASQEPGFRYLQHLFLGEVLEETGDPTGAASEYDRAIALVGNSQAARIAGAHVVHGSGRRIEAAAGLTSALAVPATIARDPWSTYLTGYWRHARDHLTRARALLGQTAGTDARE